MYKYFTPIFSGLSGDGLCGYNKIDVMENDYIFRVDSTEIAENRIMVLVNNLAEKLQFVEWESPVIVETERPSNRQWHKTRYTEIESDYRF